MARDKKPTLNNPFHEAKARLQALLPKPVAKAGKQPPVARVAPPEPKVSDEELFLREMAGVRRVAAPSPRKPKEVDRPAPPRPSEDAEVHAQLCDLVLGTGAWDIADTDEYIEGMAPGMDKRVLQRLRKGDYAIQGHLDLHGMTSEEAREKVERFVQEARVAGKRCVLIVHGRGLNSKDQIPVLKERVRVWLTRGRVARVVLCFASARPVDGGTGAVYVLLRK